MKTLPALTTLALAALTFTGCAQQSTPAAAPTTESTTAATATAAAAEYLEVDGKPGIKVSDLNADAQAGIATARTNHTPLYVQEDTVYWLDSSISYKEREIVENEARSEWEEHAIRSVEGFGTGELTIYRHNANPYTISVDES